MTTGGRRSLQSVRGLQSVRSLQSGQHREVPHVQGQQFGIQDQGGGCNEVVSRVYPWVGAPIRSRQVASQPGHRFGHRQPIECKEESLRGRQFAVTYSGQEFEANDFAGCQGFASKKLVME